MTGATIIIGDGKEGSRRKLKDLLVRAGYLVEGEATNAPELLRKTRTRYPDLVIMDSHLEGGSVAEIAGIIQGDELSSVLIITHGNPRIPEDVAHIHAPYGEETILSVIEVLLLYQSRLNSVRQEVTALKENLIVRKQVEKAKGILMKQFGIDEAEAYRTMQKESMNKSISMKEMARAIITAFNQRT